MPEAPQMPSLNMDVSGLFSGASNWILVIGIWFFAIFAFVVFMAWWRGMAIPGIAEEKQPFEKFRRKLTVVKQDGKNLKIATDWGRDFEKNSEQMLKIGSDRTVIPGGIRGDVILYSPAPGKYMHASLELAKGKDGADDPGVLLHILHDDDAARLIHVTKQREIVDRFDLKSFLEKWAGPILAFVGIFIIVILLIQTWGQISSAISNLVSIAGQQAQTTAQLTELINKTYTPPIPGR